MMTTYTKHRIGPLAVLVDDETGEVVAVQDALTGLAACLMYSKADIARAEAQARIAAASLADLG